jgi:hypothetical protein
LDPVNGGEPPIVQTFSVTGGTSYVVSYEDAIESGDSTTGDSLVADTADGNLGANPFNESHYTAPGSTTFQPESFTFTAGSTATLETIIFQATGPDGHGAVPVDVTDVSVVAVPEPASIALLAVGAIGLLARRRAV